MEVGQKLRVQEVLKRHQIQLEGFLNDPERDAKDLHYIIAGQLRVLLCDSDVPILIHYAKEHNIELKVWGPFPAGFTFNPNKSVFSLNALVASYFQEYDAYEMSISDYLDTVIGAVPKFDKAKNTVTGTISYTPRQLIKWISNKDGVTHLELSPMQSLESVKTAITVEGIVEGFKETDNLILRNSIIQIGEWTNEAIKDIFSKT